MPLEILGPGFGRTGTHALKLAVEQLGFGPAHHMFEVRDNPEQLPNWEAAARGERVDWEDDFPGAKYWRELAQYLSEGQGDPFRARSGRVV
jgi:hypothetical protein